MNRMTIYYFSATGNSLKIALDVAKIGEHAELIPIKENMRISFHPESDKVGFIFPVYMGTLPDMVKQFLLNFPVKKECYYFSIATCYTYKGLALSVVDKILKDKGAGLNYGNYVSMVGNCLMEYEVPAQKREPRLRKAREKTMLVVEEIKENKQSLPFSYSRLATSLHNALFRFFFKDAHNKFSLEKGCVGCRKCERVCPVNNITLVEQKPVWGDNCKACHACVHWCPQNAINIGKSKGRLQYHNPDITYKQLVGFGK